MAITDLQISDTIEAGAPSIKYGEGDVQRQVPENSQERMMAQQIWESLGPDQQSQFITFEQFYTSGAWKQILAQMQQQAQQQQEQPMAYGGIAGLGGRRRYGIGSSIKKRLRKIIPNEVAQIAQVAAPFVAPFNPIAGGLMSGIGGFDRHGSISKGLKSGLMNYAGGQAARYLGGAGLQTGINPMTGSGVQGAGFFSSPMGTNTGLGKMFSKKPTSPLKETRLDKLKNVFPGSEGTLSDPKEKLDFIDKAKPKGIKLLDKFLSKTGMKTAAMAGILGASALAGIYTKKNPGDDSLEDISRGEGMDIEGIRAEVIEAFKDPSGEKLAAIRIKYPFLGSKESKNMDLMAEGGRIGLEGGGDPLLREEYNKYVFDLKEINPNAIPMSFEEFAAQARAGMAKGGVMCVPGKEYPWPKEERAMAQEGGLMDLGGMEKDYRNDGGFVPIGGKEKADDVPARLSKNEFVFTADAVRGAGGGDIDKGAEIMENIMKNLEQGGKISEETQGLSGAREMFKVSERLSEVV